MGTKVIFFNGPPRSGKDFMAAAVRERLCVTTDAATMLDHLARPMRECAMEFVQGVNTMSSYNAIKDEPQALFARWTATHANGFNNTLKNDSIREFMIALSEDFIKPRYGKDFWGRKLRLDHSRWWGQEVILFIPDLGFIDELAFFETLCGPQNVLTVQLDRAFIDWGNDSRSYVSGEYLLKIKNEDDATADSIDAIIEMMMAMKWIQPRG